MVPCIYPHPLSVWVRFGDIFFLYVTPCQPCSLPLPPHLPTTTHPTHSVYIMYYVLLYYLPAHPNGQCNIVVYYCMYASLVLFPLTPTYPTHPGGNPLTHPIFHFSFLFLFAFTYLTCHPPHPVWYCDYYCVCFGSARPVPLACPSVSVMMIG